MSHEEFKRDDEVEISSPRSFGVVFAAVFAIIGLWPLLAGSPVRIWSIAVAAAFAAVALFAPRWLAAPNRLWAKFGLAIGKVVNPIITGILFFAVFTPFGFVMRRFRKDSLHRGFDRDASTYWIDRDPPGPDPATMNRQF